MLIKGDIDSPLSSALEAHLIWNADNILKRDHAQIEDVIMGALLVGDTVSSTTICLSMRLRYMFDFCTDYILYLATRGSEGVASRRPHGPVSPRGRTPQGEIPPR